MPAARNSFAKAGNDLSAGEKARLSQQAIRVRVGDQSRPPDDRRRVEPPGVPPPGGFPQKD